MILVRNLPDIDKIEKDYEYSEHVKKSDSVDNEQEESTDDEDQEKDKRN